MSFCAISKSEWKCVRACECVCEWVNGWAELSCVAFVANARWFRHIDFDKHIQFSCPAYFSSEIFLLCVWHNV